MLFKIVIFFCLNSLVEQYNIIAKFGTFFYDPPGIKEDVKLMELSVEEAANLTRDREKWRSLVATSSSAYGRLKREGRET